MSRHTRPSDGQQVAYGYPSTELSEAAERGEVFLGGCVLYRDFPSHHVELMRESGEPIPPPTTSVGSVDASV